MFSSKQVNWQKQADDYLLNGKYSAAIDLYETAIEAQADQRSYYWNLGLLLLLDGQEEAAQTTWLWAMADGSPEQVELWSQDLVRVLETEAQRRENLEEKSVSWAIRQHIREIQPANLQNLFWLISLSIQLGNYTGEELAEWGLVDLLNSETPATLDSSIVIDTLKLILDYTVLEPQSLEFVSVCIRYIREPSTFIDWLLNRAVTFSAVMHDSQRAAKLAELALTWEPDNTKILLNLATYYQNAGQHLKGIETAKRSYTLMESLADKAFANHMVLRGIMAAGKGHSEEANSILQLQESLLGELFESNSGELDSRTTMRLFSTPFFFPYLRDNLAANMRLRRQVAQVAQQNITRYAQDKLVQVRQTYSPIASPKVATRRLKIGYLSQCLRTHSVGWLAKSLFEYHSGEKFEIHSYLINAGGREDPMQDWYVEHSHKARQFPAGSHEILDRIYEDNLDILIDLDSVTLDVCCEIMALKLAPIQATWLGWDAVGLKSIDYYIADPYVLPENAQDYYSETIWRLPQTYIAVDGFEVAIPTVRRETLDIPSDAVIYLSAQSGFKYNRNIARLQMQILKEVPNSYFLIKDLTADPELVKSYFTEVAEEVGVNPDRLRRMPIASTSPIHRANLAIADVVLDTYPYNGATTTMETLWMCVPMVTRVGEQFAARNSYTMMLNAGITEGIAWSDEEYVEWGINLGRDEQLRGEIYWKLRKSQQTAPLWNGQQFTREMETAYEQMWQRYIDN